MELLLENLAALIGAELIRGDRAVRLNGVASLENASPTRIAPYTNELYREALRKTRAGAVLLAHGAPLDDVPPDTAVLTAVDPELVFLKAIDEFHVFPKPAPGIASTAVIHPEAHLGAHVHLGPNVVIGARTLVGDNVVIEANTVIAEDCTLGDDSHVFPNVTFYPQVRLGKRVTVHAGCVLGGDGFGYKFRNGQHIKVPHVGFVELEDDVEVGPNSCIDRGMLGPTRIGRGTKIDNLCQIAHNNTIGQHCIICGASALAGSCTLEDYVVIGGNVGLSDHAYMEKGSRAGAKSGVVGRVPAGTEVWGLIATERSKAFASYGALRRLPQLFDRVRALEKKLRERE